MIAGGADPAAGAEDGGSDRKSGDQSGHRKAVEDGYLPEQGVIVDQRSDPQGERSRPVSRCPASTRPR